MRYFNAVQVSRELNISDKTVRRYVKKGRIKATRSESGELAIAESEVERLRRELEAERVQSILPSQSLDNLSAKVAELERRVAVLEESRQISTPIPPSVLSTPSPMPFTDIPTDLPEGSLHSTEFAEKLGLSRLCWPMTSKLEW